MVFIILVLLNMYIFFLGFDMNINKFAFAMIFFSFISREELSRWYAILYNMFNRAIIIITSFYIIIYILIIHQFFFTFFKYFLS